MANYMKLTKEECNKALDNLRVFSLKNLNAPLQEIAKSSKCLEELINEHFDKQEKLICEECGKEINFLKIDKFNYDGSDSMCNIDYCLFEDVIVITTDINWVGYELSEEEMLDTIECPHCHKYPLKHKELQIEPHFYEDVDIYMHKGVEDENN